MFFLILIAAIIIFDQFTKYLALKKLKHQDFHPILKNKVILTLHKNKGVALNLFENYPKLIKIVLVPVISLLIFFLLKIINKKNFMLTKMALGFIIGGGIGNLVDRIKQGYVIDFFTFNFRKSPIFNFADIFIILGSIILQFIFIFKRTPID